MTAPFNGAFVNLPLSCYSTSKSHEPKPFQSTGIIFYDVSQFNVLLTNHKTITTENSVPFEPIMFYYARTLPL